MIRLPVLAAALVFCTIAAPAAIAQQSRISVGAERASDRAIGDPAAPLVLIEYASPGCGGCAYWHQQNWDMVRDEFIETGQVRFIVREVASGIPQLAYIGSILARCAPRDRYFDALGLWFHRFGNIVEAAQAGGAREVVFNIAAESGLSEAEFEACLADPAMGEALDASSEEANADGVANTPTFFLNGVRITSGHAPGIDGHVYLADGEPLRIAGEYAPMEGDSFRRIILHFLTQAGNDAGGDDGNGGGE